MADWIKEISDRAKQGLDIAKEAVTDKDALNQLKYHLAETAINALYTGKGSSVTKIVTVGLIAIISLTALVKWVFQGGSLYEVLLGPGMLITAYGTGTTVKRILEKKNGSQSTTMGSRRLRPPYTPVADRGPSDTKRDHPSGR